MNTKGYFITLEGGEGSGKSSVIKLIVERLQKEGYQVLQTREPGGVKIAEEIRNIILDKANTSMDGKTEALLYAASRRQHLVEKVIPALDKGMIVISDRYIDSSLVYQGVARGIGIQEVYEMNLFAIDKILPNLTLILDIEPEIGLQRINKNNQREVNRLDLESLSFHHKVRDGYLKLKDLYPERIEIVDASKSLEEVFENCYSLIEKTLKNE